MRKQKRTIVLCGIGAFLATCAVTAIVHIVLAAPTQPVHSVELTSQNTSFENQEPGAWKVTKWAGWSSKNTARVVFDIETILKKKNEHDDVLFVVDTTSAMSGKLDDLRGALKRFANEFLNDQESSVGLIQFNQQYEILSNFTNNKEEFCASVDEIYNYEDVRDYYQGLNGAEMLMRNYAPSDDHGLTVVMILAGIPNEETMFQKAQYRLIKSKYPFVTINSVLYSNVVDVNGLISDSSDNQFVVKTNIDDVIYTAAISAYFYDSFTIKDYINTDYFEINPDSAPYSTNGIINIDGDTVTLSLIDSLRTGSSVQFEIDLKLKENIDNPDDLYPTNTKVEIASVLFDTPSENIVSNSTPILKKSYKVTYNPNQPSDCVVSGVPAEQESHLVYSVVGISETTPTCSGYNFAGYKIVTSSVRKMNDDFFWMPENDIEIAATWTKVDIEKSMDGAIFDVTYLYDEIAKASSDGEGGFNLDNYVSFISAPSDTNGRGVMTIASTALDEYPIHYYRGTRSENNVLFGNTCWLIVRTTSLGGIKLIYNGEAVNDNCNVGPGSHMGYITRGTARIDTNYYYSTDYNFENGMFSLAGEKTIARYNGNNFETIRGKYTCLSASIDATCSIIYLADGVFNSASAYFLRLSNSGASKDNIGGFAFNGSTKTASSVGYMKVDDESLYASTNFNTSGGMGATLVTKQATLSTNYWFADDAVYDAGSYELIDPYKVSSADDYPSLVGKYTFRDSSHDYSNNVIYYIVGVNGNSMYYLELSNGQTVADVDTTHAFGDDIIENQDGTYTLVNPFYITKTEWATRFRETVGKYTCKTSEITCDDPSYIFSSAEYSYTGFAISEKIVLSRSHNNLELTDAIIVPYYIFKQNYEDYLNDGYVFSCGKVAANRVSTTCSASSLMLILNAGGGYLYTYVTNYYFASSVQWDGSKYILVDTIGLENYNNLDALSTHHYFCPNSGQTSCTTVRYIYSHTGSSSMHYVTMSNGITTPEEVLALSRSNQIDSSIKNGVDRWYEHYLIDYTDKLEDSVFCNDRSIYEAGGWATNGRLDVKLTFNAKARNMLSESNPDLSCNNPEDAFTVSSENGNGKLTYPVGLITADEAMLMGRSPVFNTLTWTMSPYDYYQNSSNGIYASYSNSKLIDYKAISTSNGYNVRPSIVLKNGAFITGGDGTAANPWTVGWE